LFFVRDHLGSPALAMQAKRTIVSGSTYRWELQPVESYEYAPYGDPTIHVPATDGSPQSAGRLALKDFESFAMTGAKSTESLLDRNDVGRPSGSSGNTWTRSGAVPVAKSFLGWSHLFTGRPWDADVRQYYIRHRWYEPLTGRWTAVDPIGYDGGINQYQYCGGNGVSFVDMTGLARLFVASATKGMPHTFVAVLWDNGTGLSQYDYPDFLRHDHSHKQPNLPEGYTHFQGYIPDDIARAGFEHLRHRFGVDPERARDEYDLFTKNCNTATKEFLSVSLRLKAAKQLSSSSAAWGATTSAASLAAVGGLLAIGTTPFPAGLPEAGGQDPNTYANFFQCSGMTREQQFLEGIMDGLNAGGSPGSTTGTVGRTLEIVRRSMRNLPPYMDSTSALARWGEGFEGILQLP